MPMAHLGGANQKNDKEEEEADPLELSEGKRHPLFENMENAKFF